MDKLKARDDEKYIQLIIAYKKARKEGDRDKEVAARKEAKELARTGKVSDDARLAGAYL